MGVICHATVMMGIPLTEDIECKLIEHYGDQFNSILDKNDISILPYDRCSDCPALIGRIVSDIDETGEESFEEIHINDLMRKGGKFEIFMSNIRLTVSPKIYNVQHWV